MNRFGKYVALAAIAAKSNLAYAAEVGSRLFFLAVILYIFMRLWAVTYAHSSGTTIGGFSLQEMLWYLAVTETVYMSIPRISALVDEDVRTGTLAVQLVRPLSYPLYRLATYVGERTVRFAVTGLAAAAIAVWLVGPLPDLPARYLFLLLSMPAAFLLDFLGYFLIGLGAFWMEDTSGLMLLYSRASMILGGMLLPIELFPEAIQQVLRLLPFGYMVYGPARMFVHPQLPALGALVANQLFWCAVFAAVVAAVHARAMERIALNGG